jgi:hypothetical protein
MIASVVDSVNVKPIPPVPLSDFATALLLEAPFTFTRPLEPSVLEVPESASVTASGPIFASCATSLPPNPDTSTTFVCASASLLLVASKVRLLEAFTAPLTMTLTPPSIRLSAV